MNAAEFIAKCNVPETTATDPQELLASMVRWHQRNEDANLPIQLLAMLVAARKVC